MSAEKRGFDGAYAGTPPWDIGRPQRAFVRLVETNAIEGAVLDVGCGTGENALYLAERGYTVWGIDASPRAIETAERKASARGLRATFLVYDAFELADLGRRFETAIDSGLFHVFSDRKHASAFAAALRTVLRPGGRYYALGFSGREPNHRGPSMTEAEIEAAFADGWEIVAIDGATFETNFESGESPALLASITRL